MTPSLAPLPDRSIIEVAGADAEALLDGLLTNSLPRFGDAGAIHTALLSPQGKILFDFFLFRTATGFLIDVAKASAADLVKRLSFYRLRADATFTDRSDDLLAAALWPASGAPPGGVISAPDPRHPDLGLRLILPPARLAEIPAETVDVAAYEAHRIALGIPSAGTDYALGDAFPHEALYDQLGSVDFKKGCFIGQEVVSRMQHRGTARKRTVRVHLSEAVAAGTEVTAGDAVIGTIGSATAETAIALLRLDRAAEARQAGMSLAAGPATVTLDFPDWLHLDPETGTSVT
jgi:folate-binding protein YgfZ